MYLNVIKQELLEFIIGSVVTLCNLQYLHFYNFISNIFSRVNVINFTLEVSMIYYNLLIFKMLFMNLIYMRNTI